jgi:hypothetical protein
MTVFVAEVSGDSGWPFEDQAIAAIEAEDVDEARDFLVTAMMAMNRRLFETGVERWDETLPILTRKATPAEVAAWSKRKAAHRDASSPVVWLVDIGIRTYLKIA